MQVRVYRNLHRDCFSVQAKVNGRWKVVDHRTTFLMYGANFKVSIAGQKRVVQEKRKNVHAYVVADIDPCILLDTFNALIDGCKLKEISYNPYKGPYFYYVDSGKPVDKVKEAVIIGTKLYEVV